MLPPGAGRELVARLEEYQRRAASKRHVPKELRAIFEFDDQTGQVVAIEVPKRIGWER